ncbi:MAG: hypothetical protein AAF518_09800 [Spirochaetota bacterium]
MGRIDLAKKGEKGMQWNDKMFSTLWGDVNKKSAAQFADKLNQRQPNLVNTIVQNIARIFQ